MSTRADRAVTASRLWWAVPVGLAIATAMVFVAVVLPALAKGSGVPGELVVHRSPAPVAPITARPTSPPPTPPPTPPPKQPPPTTVVTTVVRPSQAVVRGSDDRHDDGAGG